MKAYVRKPDYAGLLALAGSAVIAEDDDPKALFRQVPLVTSRAAGRAAPGSVAQDADFERIAAVEPRLRFA